MSLLGQTAGQGAEQFIELGAAFAMSLSIGFERQAQQKSAGLRTYTLVGLGSALFMLLSKYGFGDVLGPHVILDPSRVAAQIVSGLGFIGGGLIFVRRDAVRGLTTAASVWLTAAISAAAGAGLLLLALTAWALYFLLMYGLRPLTRLAERFRPNVFSLAVTYQDGRGLLREVINLTTQRGFAIEELNTAPADAGADAASVRVVLVLAGRGDLAALSPALDSLAGVHAVQISRATPNE